MQIIIHMDKKKEKWVWVVAVCGPGDAVEYLLSSKTDAIQAAWLIAAEVGVTSILLKDEENRIQWIDPPVVQ